MTDRRDFPALGAGERHSAEGGAWLARTDPADDVRRPFGGFRDSGSPFKEPGPEAPRFCVRVNSAAARYPA
jgi:hypothetical protein